MKKYLLHIGDEKIETWWSYVDKDPKSGEKLFIKPQMIVSNNLEVLKNWTEKEHGISIVLEIIDPADMLVERWTLTECKMTNRLNKFEVGMTLSVDVGKALVEY